jgi:hypothetical protein
VKLRRVKRGDGVGYIDDLGYRRFYVAGKNIRAHQIAYFLVYGEWTMVDHRNGNKLDNRLENLRKATKSQNAANCGALVTNKLGVKGVSRCGNRYRADIRIQGKGYNLGRYDTIEEAAAAYARAAKAGFGDFARTA